MFTTLSAVSALALAFAPISAPVPSANVCAAHLDAGSLRPAWCGRKPPPKSYETFRRALSDYQTSAFYMVDTLAGAIGSLSPIDSQCRDNPPVDPTTVDLIVSGAYLSAGPQFERSRAALAKMLSVTDSLFEVPTLAEVKATVKGLSPKVDEFEAILKTIEAAGDSYKIGDCETGQASWLKASDDLVATGQYSNRTVVSLSRLLSTTHKPCKSATVKDPYSDKALKKASGAKSVKTTKVGDMSMDYPSSVDLGGPTWLPLNLDSSAPSGFVQVTLTQGAKPLAALGGGTPAGGSGVRIKVMGTPKRGPAKLQVTFSPAGGTQLMKTVTIRLS
jgi:hypothetical protein